MGRSPRHRQHDAASLTLALLAACAGAPPDDDPPDSGDEPSVTVRDEAIGWAEGGFDTRLPDPGQIGVGDADGDGTTELVVGSVRAGGGGGVYVVEPDRLRAEGDEIEDIADALFYGPATASLADAGRHLADVTGDGAADVVLGSTSAPEPGALLAVFEAWQVTGRREPSDSLYDVIGTAEGLATVDAAADRSGDGVAEIAYGLATPGRVHVFDAADWLPGSVALADADVTFQGVGAGRGLGEGDLDGDGHDELLIRGDGLAWILSAGQDTLAAARLRVEGLAVTERFCDPRLADVDADGRIDLVVGDPGADRVWVFRDVARFEGVVDVGEALAISGAVGSELGASIDVVDLDGDGSADVLAGAPGARSGSGEAVLYSDGNLVQAARTWVGADGEALGLGAVLLPGEAPRLVLGAPDAVGSTGVDGRIYLLAP